jgi:hypothetical protein
MFQVPRTDDLLWEADAGLEHSQGWSPETASFTTFSPAVGRSGPVILTPWLGRYFGRFPWARIRFRCPHCLRWSGAPLHSILKIDHCPACARPIWLNHFFIRGNWRSIANSR